MWRIRDSNPGPPACKAPAQFKSEGCNVVLVCATGQNTTCAHPPAGKLDRCLPTQLRVPAPARTAFFRRKISTTGMHFSVGSASDHEMVGKQSPKRQQQSKASAIPLLSPLLVPRPLLFLRLPPFARRIFRKHWGDLPCCPVPLDPTFGDPHSYR